MHKKTVGISYLIFSLLLGACTSNPKANRFAKIDVQVDSVMQLMTLDEKIGQLVQLTSKPDGTLVKESVDIIKKGQCGSILGAYSAASTRKLQQMAMNNSRLGIPLIYGNDVIHGFKTLSPIPLGEAASWDMEAIEKSARVAATEASAAGMHWTFAPMCDISIDPRWGRVSEGAGEDPYLGSLIAAARVRGFQGRNNDLSDTLTMLACVKHFAAYGAPIAGREYNSADMSERTLREVYLKPYKAAIEQGAMSVMTSFNDLNGTPATANQWLLKDILRGEMNFKGFVVSDFNSISQLMSHGVASDEEEACSLAINAGTDMDMFSKIYLKHLKQLVESGSVKESVVDKSVRRVLRVKFMLGLFDDPYRYCSESREKRYCMTPEHLKAAYDMAEKSFVLLKNDNQALPLKKGEHIAVIGFLSTAKRELLGSWRSAGVIPDSMSTVVDEIKRINGINQVSYARGCGLTENDRSGFAEAIKVARQSDKIVIVAGEPGFWNGEGKSRTNIKIPGVQTELLRELKKLDKPIILVLMNGRPLDLSEENELSDAMLETWLPGTRGANAVADVLFGKYNPSGKLPMTFPRNVGQVPIFYYEKSTGAPADPDQPFQKGTSRYLDCVNDPLFAFGYGLSYTNFSYSSLILSDSILTQNGAVNAGILLSNTGKYDGEEVVQLYIRDLAASVTRPVKELKKFEKVFLKAGESKTVNFKITPEMLAFYRKDMSYGTESGKFMVFVGGSSRSGLHTSFWLK